MVFKNILLILIISFSNLVLGDTSVQKGGVRFDVSYGLATFDPVQLNATHENKTVWTVPVQVDDFKSTYYYAISAGKVFDLGILSLRYQAWRKDVGDQSKKYTGTFQGGNVSFTYYEYFLFEGVYVTADIPFKFNQFLEYTLGGGLGYTFRYEFHAVDNACKYCTFPCDDANYNSHPTAFMARSTLGFKLTHFFGVFAEGIYEYVSAKEMKAKLATLQNTQGENVEVNMSGFRLGVGLRLDY